MPTSRVQSFFSFAVEYRRCIIDRKRGYTGNNRLKAVLYEKSDKRATREFVLNCTLAEHD